MLFEVL